MAVDTGDALLQRLASLPPERREMLRALLDDPASPALAAPVAPAPRAPTATEQSLRAIWEQVLGIAAIGLDDDFFAIGGDSIAAMRVVAKAQKAGIPISVRDLTIRPTITALAAATRESASAFRADDTRPLPLTAAQWRAAGPGLLRRGSMTAWISARVSLVERRVLPQSLAAIARRHQALRWRLRQSAAGWELIDGAPDDRPAPLVDLRALTADAATACVTRLERQRITVSGEMDDRVSRLLCWQAHGEAGLIVACSRWCVDRASLAILTGEMNRLRQALLGGRPALLPPPARFSAWARDDAGAAAADLRRAGVDRGAQAYELRGTIRQEVMLPPSWTPDGAAESLDSITRAGLIALARASDSGARDFAMCVAADARTSVELSHAVGYYIRLIEFVWTDDPPALQLARQDESAPPAAVGFSVFVNRVDAARAGDRVWWNTSGWLADTPYWSRQPLDVHNEVVADRWITVWRFDRRVHSIAAMQERCARFLAELARVVVAPEAPSGTAAAAFGDAELLPGELDGLFAT